MDIDILNGNELIVRGGLEAGFSLYTGYPGSPLADYFNILHQKKTKLEERGIRVVIANSEANAAAMASGAKQAGRDCLVAMKSMGLHVASDALSVGNFADPGAVQKDPQTGEQLSSGVVIAVGDDPWSMSTSTPADSRFLYKHLHIPFLEPSTPQELKDWMNEALQISKRTGLYQGLLLTTFMAEGGGRVELGDEAAVEKEKTTLDPETFDLRKNVMVPPNSLFADQAMITERFPRVKNVYQKHSLDKSFGDLGSKYGVISSGVIFETLKQVLEERGALEEVHLYKLASSYPLVDDILLPYLKSLHALVVVEEKRGFLETQVRELCQRHGLSLPIYGKLFGEKEEGFPAHGGLHFETVEEKLFRAFKLMGKLDGKEQTQQTPNIQGLDLPLRLPTFCPGCPHRETLSLLKDLRKTLKKEDIDLITHGDVGCYSLSFLPPFKEMHNLSAMGQGGALGAGVDLFTDNPSVVLMGDSTFFHSGMTDVSNSVQCGHDITYILLDNDNTAMTGHQMTPRSGLSVDGHVRPEQDMLHLVKSLGVEEVIEVNPSDRYFYRSLLLDYVKKTGVKVIVSKKECALTFHGRRKASERKIFAENKTLSQQSFYQINTDACEDCRVCVEETGCPGLTQVFDAYGSKVAIDPQICVSDSYCTKFEVCPSFERVDVFDYHPTMYQKKVEVQKDESLKTPNPLKTFDDIAAGNSWRAVVTGVGGSGVTTISKVLSHAAKSMGGRDDLDFKFVDQKGLAQRNGNVTAHLAIFKKGDSYGAITPQGSADLLVSPDLLDGSKHISFLSNSGRLILDEHYQTPLSIMLDEGDVRPPLSEKVLTQQLQDKLGQQAQIFPLKTLSELALGRAVYASAMILGVAFQEGRLPFSLEDMKKAFEGCMKKSELHNNWQSFELGRSLVQDGKEKTLARFKTSQGPSHEELLRQSLRESCTLFESASKLLEKYEQAVAQLSQYFPDLLKEHLAQYVHDLLIFDRGARLDSFIEQAKTLTETYLEKDWARALRTLAKTYWLKDEVYVAHIMISPVQRLKDREHYAALGRSFKKTRMNRPEFKILGKSIEFEMNPRDWMLKLVRHQRWTRAIFPGWHREEKIIAHKVRQQVVSGPETNESSYQHLVRLENIKGYRQVRFDKAKNKLSHELKT